MCVGEEILTIMYHMGAESTPFRCIGDDASMRERLDCGVHMWLYIVMNTMCRVVARIVVILMKQTAEKCLEWRAGTLSRIRGIEEECAEMFEG